MNTAQTNLTSSHDGNNKYYETCGKGFKSRFQLFEHNKIHLGTQPFMCNIFDKHFARKSNLSRHQLTHSGLKIYQCDICEKMFCTKRLFAKACNSSYL